MSDLKNTIITDMKKMMKARNTQDLITIRMLLSAIKQKEIDERVIVTDDNVIVIVQKMIKQRKDSASQFQQGNRQDLADQELSEIKVLQVYLPKQMTQSEINQAISEVINSFDQASLSDMGKIMGLLKPKLSGKVEMSVVSQLVRSALS